MRKRCFQCGSILDKEIGSTYMPEMCEPCWLEFTKKQDKNSTGYNQYCPICGENLFFGDFKYPVYKEGVIIIENLRYCRECYRKMCVDKIRPKDEDKSLQCKECGKDIISCYNDGEPPELCLSCYKRTVLKEPPTQVYRCYGCGEDIGHEGICKECDFVLQNNKVNKMIERLLDEVKGLVLDNSYHFCEKKEQDKLRNLYFNTWEEISHYFKEPYPRENPTPKEDAQEYFDYLYRGTDCGAK